MTDWVFVLLHVCGGFSLETGTLDRGHTVRERLSQTPEQTRSHQHSPGRNAARSLPVLPKTRTTVHPTRNTDNHETQAMSTGRILHQLTTS